jgi:protein lysine acetyltransferase
VSGVSSEELAALDAFADIPAQALAALAANLEPLHASAGQVLMRQGDRAVSFSIITSGQVEVRDVGPDGEAVITQLSPGTIVGEIALLRGFVTRNQAPGRAAAYVNTGAVVATGR